MDWKKVIEKLKERSNFHFREANEVNNQRHYYSYLTTSNVLISIAFALEEGLNEKDNKE